MTRSETELGRPLSVVLRDRLVGRKMGFHANDNISQVMGPGDQEALVDEVAANVEALLRSLVIDIDTDHNTKDTARRHAKMLVNEVFSGRYTKEPAVTAFPNAKQLDQMYLVGPITMHSTCSHHLCPIIGRAYVGVLGGEYVLGLSKFNRLTRFFAQRPQIQEELTVQVAERIMELSKARGVAVMIESTHFCGVIRGVHDNTKMVTTQLLGDFLESASLKEEFYRQVDRAA